MTPTPHDQMTRRLITLILTAVAAALPAPIAAAQDNQAVAVNTEDEALVFELAFDLHRTMDNVVDESNTAVAYASCERCRTIAVAFQVVLAMAAADTVVPVNVAAAVNEECTACETLAFAYQLVIAGDQPVRLTREGRARIRHIRKALRALRDSDAPLDQILAELQRRAAELREVVATELVPVGRRADRGTAAPEASADPGETRWDPADAAEPASDPVGPSPTVGEAPSVDAPPEPGEPTPAVPGESPTPEPTETPTSEPTEPPSTAPSPTPEPPMPAPAATATPTPTASPASEP